MKNNTKTIVIDMNEGDVQHHEPMDCEDVQHLRTLKLKHRRITSIEETSRGYKNALKSIADGLHSISQYSQH